jgi:ubiquitin carboxyl-terminal hydrolase 4/11/15
LKRFTNNRYGSTTKKVDFVDAPQTLDMSPYVRNTSGIFYELYAVSNHFGGLGGGHYTAYVKNPLDLCWYNCDDSYVTKLNSEVVTPATYLLFYRRKSHPPDDLKSAILLSSSQKLRENYERKKEQIATERDAVERDDVERDDVDIERGAVERDEQIIRPFPSLA